MKNCAEIPGYEGLYIINTEGKVFSSNSNNEKKCTYDNYGYARVQLHKKGVRKYFKIHRLVAIIFIPNPECHYTVNHKDGNKTNNNVYNLEWCSDDDNRKHAKNNGLILKGGNSPRAKLTEDDVVMIRSSTIRSEYFAKLFNVSLSAIRHVRSRNSWKHI